MEANRRKTLHPAYRVTDLDMSLGFYTALGYQLLGQILRRDERATEAEERLRPALALYPGDAALMGAYGAALEALGHYEEAAQHYQEGMRLAPNDAMLHGQLGNLLMRQGAFDLANTHLELSADLFPDRPTTRVNLAALKLKLGEWDAAEREAGAAISLRPESAPAHASLGRALLQQGKLKEGIGLPNPPLYYALQDFLKSVAEQKPATCTAADGFRAAAIALRLDEAIGKNEELAIGPEQLQGS
jgi:tetratricopeptide (TPR) repeat protein